MILRVNYKDVSEFSGYVGGDNNLIDNYIEIFNESACLNYFQISGNYNDITIDFITYVSHRVPDCKMFTKVDVPDDGNYRNAVYTLCFVRNAE